MVESGTTELVGRPAMELAALVRDRTASAREVVEEHLARIGALNPPLNAIVTLRAEEALTEADEVDRRVAGGDSLPLAGVPFTVKDLIAAGGVRTTAGTPPLRDFVPRMDATAVGRLRSAGGILLGKTNCPEWGMFPYTRNSLFGATDNPVRPGLTPGGSSGGESASVAAGLSAIGVGTDFGGSVRWPAHCTGILALRPTLGRIPGTGQLPTASLDEPLIPNAVTLQGRAQMVGPLARTVEDLEAALDVMAGPDGLDPFAVPAPLGGAANARVERVAIWEGPASPEPRGDVLFVIREAAQALEGHTTVAEEQPNLLERAVTLYGELRDLDRLQDVRRLMRGHEDEVGADVRHAMEAAAEAERVNPLPDPARTWEERDRLRAAFLAFLDRHPILLMAVATLPAYDLAETPTVNGHEQSMWDVLAPSRVISLFGVPAASVPFGRSADGLPIGVQVVGRPFREDEVLAVAQRLMEARPET
jgi:Asp-tRNA(Asn)/Glu-tRNA(Gln) amidotransferase A subunit family amidase